MKKILLLCIYCLVTHFCLAQFKTRIDSLVINPKYADTLSLIQLFAYNQVCGGPLLGDSIVFQDSLIQIWLGHNTLIDDSCYSYKDIVEIGNLPIGQYVAICHLRDQNLEFEYDVDTIIFRVDSLIASSIASISRYGKFSVYPNPVKDYIEISFLGIPINQRLEYEIIDMNGGLRAYGLLDGHRVMIERIAIGRYILILKHHNEIILMKQFIKD